MEKPEYLKTSRNRARALEYGYDDPVNVRSHIRDYRASVEQMDAAVGRVLDELDRRGLTKNTWVIVMGDNGWFLGEHGMTSKVLPYEESMRVPMAIAGPARQARVSDQLVLNIDVAATLHELAGVPVPPEIHGRSLLPLVTGHPPADWRTSFLYEAPTSQLGSQPLWALRSERWKYIETKPAGEADEMMTELYDLRSDPIEVSNLAEDPAHQTIVTRLAAELREHQRSIDAKLVNDKPAFKSQSVRTDLRISGIYPHLTTYGIYSQNGAHDKKGHNECGIGAIVPWADKLWMVNYAPHMPRGSEHKLFSVDADLSKPITVHPESVGGTPAGRMIHQESDQLLIGHHLVDARGNVRTIQPSQMPIRVT
ncbi:MAG: sulfatase/phosphatase domain-containing protein, partial [Planctomycetota bacterium]